MINKLNILKNPNSLLFVFNQGKILIGKLTKSLDKIEEIIPSCNMFNDFPATEDGLIHLGVFKNYDCYAIELEEQLYVSEKYNFIPFRSLAGMIDEELFFMAGRGAQLLSWSKNNKFCGRCGNPNSDKEDETAKVCSKCGNVVYPRISPAIIVAITKDHQILLAHNNKFRPGLFTVIAGFAEPGETLHQTVAREVFEETGLNIKNIKFFGSQPWPFPDSLMIAFTAEYESGEISVDGEELAEAHWYSANSLPDIPAEGTIAKKLIDDFVKHHGGKC